MQILLQGPDWICCGCLELLELSGKLQHVVFHVQHKHGDGRLLTGALLDQLFLPVFRHFSLRLQMSYFFVPDHLVLLDQAVLAAGFGDGGQFVHL